MHIWKTSLHRLRQDWQQVFATHLAYAVLGLVIFAPLLGLLGRLLLKLSDKPALADQDIAWFLLSPAGMVALVLLAALLITIASFEQATLMTLGAGKGQGVHLGTVNALRFTAAYAHLIFAFALRLVVRVLLLTLPFLAIGGAIAWLLLTDYDINYYLNEQPPIFWVAAISIGLLLLVMLALLVHKLIGWSLALPLVLFSGVSPAQSFTESETGTLGAACPAAECRPAGYHSTTGGVDRASLFRLDRVAGAGAWRLRGAVGIRQLPGHGLHLRQSCLPAGELLRRVWPGYGNAGHACPGAT
jgi:hypothetical protein